MAWQDKTYVILPIGSVTQDMIDECLESSTITLKMNIAETHTILKWLDRNGKPATIAALDPAPTEYTNTEIVAIIIDTENGWVEE